MNKWKSKNKNTIIGFAIICSLFRDKAYPVDDACANGLTELVECNDSERTDVDTIVVSTILEDDGWIVFGDDGIIDLEEIEEELLGVMELADEIPVDLEVVVVDGVEVEVREVVWLCVELELEDADEVELLAWLEFETDTAEECGDTDGEGAADVFAELVELVELAVVTFFVVVEFVTAVVDEGIVEDARFDVGKDVVEVDTVDAFVTGLVAGRVVVSVATSVIFGIKLTGDVSLHDSLGFSVIFKACACAL